MLNTVHMSQIFWLFLCLYSLVFVCKKYIVPKMNSMFAARDSYVKKCSEQAGKSQYEMEKISAVISVAKTQNCEECNTIVHKAIINSKKREQNQINVILQEHIATMNGVRIRASEDIKDVPISCGTLINSLSSLIFEKICK